MTADQPARYYIDPGGRKQARREARIRELMAGKGLDRPTCELMYDTEEAPLTTDHAELTAAGFALPPAHELDDAALTPRLHELIRELAAMHVYLSFTDHLSDRELYELLLTSALHQERGDTPLEPGSGWHVLMTDFCPDDDQAEALAAAYDDDDGRRPSGILAFDRDRHLPQP